MKPAVAVVDAETPGNVGTVARAMKNFGFEDLLLVDPPPLDPDGEAYGFAGHAREDILPDSEEISFGTLVSEFHTVGFTAIPNEDGTSHVRFPVRTPAALAEELAGVAGPTALVFGRERTGLTNDELARIDEVCTIPASPTYPTLNLGQAATVALYALRGLALEDDHLPDVERERAPEPAVEGLYKQLGALLSAVDYPEHKRQKTMRLARRLVGRAHPTTGEVTTLRGVFRRAAAVARGQESSPVADSENPD